MARRRTRKVPVETRPSERRAGILIAIFGFALAVRLLHLALASRAPFFDLRLGDGLVYDAWARSIWGGDLIGHGVFYQAPLYPYFLALVYATVGDSVSMVRLVQEVMSALGCVLVADAAWRLFSRGAGIAAGVLIALYAPSIFLDGLVQKSALDMLLVSLVVWLTARLIAEARTTTAAGLGLAAGALALTRENAIVLLVPILAWLLTRRDLEWPRRRQLALVAACGAAVALVPVAIRNTAVTGQFVLTSSQFGPNFYIGNNPDADGTYRSLFAWRGNAEYEQGDAAAMAEKAEGRALTPSEVSTYYTRAAFRFIASQPGRWIALVGRKLRFALSATEIEDTEDQYTWSEWSWPLRLGVVWNFGTLFSLAVAGVWLSRREWPRTAVLIAVAATYLASLLLFYVFARYRFPLVPVLMIFAGFAVDAVVSARSLHRPSAPPSAELIVCSVTTIGLAAFCLLPISQTPQMMKAVTHYNVGVGLESTGDSSGAVRELRTAVTLNPALSIARYRLGVALAQQGDLAGASAELTETIRRLPDYAPAHNNLGVVLGRLGRSSDAEKEFRAAIADDPQYAQARVNLGQMLVFDRRTDEAVQEFQRALAIDPNSEVARDALQRITQRER